jgi:hypothetical protein
MRKLFFAISALFALSAVAPDVARAESAGPVILSPAALDRVTGGLVIDGSVNNTIDRSANTAALVGGQSGAGEGNSAGALGMDIFTQVAILTVVPVDVGIDVDPLP